MKRKADCQQIHISMSVQSKLRNLYQFLIICISNLLSKKSIFSFSSKLVRFAVASIIAFLILKYGLKYFYFQYYDRVRYVEDVKSILHKRYDFIVIGSGTSGSCVAGVLTRGGTRNNRPNVLLIEAGDKDTYHPLSNEVIPVMMLKGQMSSKDWKYETIPQLKGSTTMINQRTKWPRGKICGGSSILNYMAYVRGHPNDYNLWTDKYGCAKHWSYSALIPYFKELENCMFNTTNICTRGLHGLQSIYKRKNYKQNAIARLFVRSAINVGHLFLDDYNDGDNSGVSYTQYTIDRNGRRQTSFRSFVASLFSKENEIENYSIDILPNTMVSKILCREENEARNGNGSGIEIGNSTSGVQNKAIGVELDGKHNIFIDYNGEIIVCGGAVNSPQILMLSGIGEQKHLMQNNIKMVADVPGVGQNLRDHFMQGFHVHWDDKKMKKLYPNFDGPLSEHMSLKQILKAFYDYLFFGSGKFVTGTIDSHIFMQSSIAKKNKWKYNDLQLVSSLSSIAHPYNDEKHNKAFAKYYNFDSDAFSERNYSPYLLRGTGDANEIDFKSTSLGLVMNVRPQSVGEILLQSNDYHCKPLINPNYLSHEEDMQAFMDGVLEVQKIYESEPFKSVGGGIINYPEIGNFETMMEKTTNERMLSVYHPVGTCKMGDVDNDEYAVCDDRLCVRLFTNLRVCDASIMPDLIGGNTQAACYVIGVKGGHMFLEDWVKRCQEYLED